MNYYVVKYVCYMIHAVYGTYTTFEDAEIKQFNLIDNCKIDGADLLKDGTISFDIWDQETLDFYVERYNYKLEDFLITEEE